MDLHESRQPLRTAYVVSRFPEVTQTFVLRELNEVASDARLEVHLFALFGGDHSVVHAEAMPWLDKCRRPTIRRGLAALCYWFRRRPGLVVRIWAEVVRDHVAEPGRMVRFLYTTAIAMGMARDVRQLGVEHLHAHFAAYSAHAARVAAQLADARYSVTPHAYDIFVSQAGLRRRLRNAEFVVAVSGYHRMFLQHFGASPLRMPIIRYGLDLGRYALGSQSLSGGSEVDAIMISSFREYKGHRVLVEALGDPRLASVRVEFIGSGPLREQVEAHVAARGLSSRIVFSGSRDMAYVRERLGQARLLIQPSIVEANGDTEGLPNTAIEGCASGVLVVGTRVAGLPELLEDGVTGFLAEPGSAASLADAIHRALTTVDPEAVRLAARHRVETDYDVTASGRAMADAILSARGTGKGGS